MDPIAQRSFGRSEAIFPSAISRPAAVVVDRSAAAASHSRCHYMKQSDVANFSGMAIRSIITATMQSANLIPHYCRAKHGSVKLLPDMMSAFEGEGAIEKWTE